MGILTRATCNFLSIAKRKETLKKHVAMSNAEERQDRHPIAPELDEEEKTVEDLEEDDDGNMDT